MSPLRQRLVQASWRLRLSCRDLAQRGSVAVQRQGPIHALLRYQWRFARRDPVSMNQWDAQYAGSNYTERLDSARQVAHHMVILGYLTYGTKPPTVLDIGCGHGRFLQLLAGVDFAEYTGVDWSDHAVEQARALLIPRTRFEVGDMDYWDTTERFNVVVLDESLYYSADPFEMFERSLGWLAEDGMVIVSMFRSLGARYIWSRIQSAAVEPLAACAVKDPMEGGVWDVKALRPRPANPSSQPQGRLGDHPAAPPPRVQEGSIVP